MLEFFVHPILRGPTLGCMFMSCVAGFVGVFVFLRKQSLVGESLSHATYPGVILGAMIAAGFSENLSDNPWISFGVMGGAFLSAMMGFYLIQMMQNSLKLSADSALCLILSTFFGLGVTLASHVQFTHTSLYKQALIYLYGQAATMTDAHIFLYAALAFVVIIVLFLFYKELKIITLDRVYAVSLGIPVKMIDGIFFTLIVLSIVIGIRSVGVVLMSAMLIAPAVAARQWSERLSVVLVLSGTIGLFSGWMGNVLSVRIGEYINASTPTSRIGIPTGPMIVLSAAFICLFSLIFAPQRGVFMRTFRTMRFRLICQRENILKSFCYSKEEIKTFRQIATHLGISALFLKWILWRLCRSGYLIKQDRGYGLSRDGKMKAAHIVRLHRLWEAYLVTYLGVGAERVHHSAEEMEHMITPELEKELDALLNHPRTDPHNQPIPPNGAYL